MASSNKSQCRTKKPKPKPLEIDLLDLYGPSKLKRIVPTSTQREDPFKAFVPGKKECLDYNISQTLLRMDVGDTLINLKEIQATYIPAPPVVPKKKKEKPPPRRFVNEMWLAKQDELQKQYKKDLYENIKLHKLHDHENGETMHNLIQALVGPDWFQELSPNQLEAVEELHCCILADLKENSITNIQQNISKLGLVLRPNHRHIKKALRLCCKDPVEFLLILYQIMNPKRKEYSLNDRLLLSGVVHLTMAETLRELHVRIPSPPREKEEEVRKQKKEKKVKYASPYLQPLIYKPILRKHTGIYENPIIQYPESPYFDYLPTLLIDRLIAEDIFDLDLNIFDQEDAEILEDMRQAQLEYNRIHGDDKIKLIRPTILQRCTDAAKFFNELDKVKRKALVLPPLPVLIDSEDEECFCSETLEADTNMCCEYESQNCSCQEKCGCAKTAQMYTSPKCRSCLSREKKKYLQRVIKGVAVIPDGTVVPIIETTMVQKTCECLQKYQDSIIAAKARNVLEGLRAQFILGGVAMTANGPVYIISMALRKHKKKITELPEVDPGPIFNLSENLYNIDDLEEEQREPQEELENQAVDEEIYCTCSRSKKIRSEKIEKSSNTENVNKSCTSTKKEDDTEQEDSSDSSSVCDCCKDCKCKERSKIYTTPRCNKCQEKERQKYFERIITGLKETTSHNLVPIIEGTRSLPPCNCLQAYAEKIISMEARNKIQSHNAQFVIGGVVFTKTGPVYILSTALQNKDADETCGKAKRKRSRSREQKRNVPEEEEEEGEVKYSGCKCKEELERFLKHKCTCELCNVKQRQEEATYIFGGSTNREDGTVNIVHGVYGQTCDCLEQHQNKMDRLEDYRQRIEARFNLKSQTLKYSIGGVVNTPDGPVYVITGIRPPVDCECAKALRRKEEEELQLQQMAKMPPTGRIKYQIAGVRTTPEGNVFIISQALLKEDCECVKLFDTYIQAHRACLDAYESFLQQTQQELEQYMAEASIPSQLVPSGGPICVTEGNSPWSHSAVEVTATTSENSISNYNLFEHGEVVRTIRRKCGGQKLNICSRVGLLYLSEDSLFSECVCYDEEESEDFCSECTNSSNTSCMKSLTCEDFCIRDFRKNNSAITEVERKQVVPEEVEPPLKRFVILKEIPKKSKKQIDIVKKVLQQMAKDGYPLAKLPECHKLPHFKLWMQLRLGKFWTYHEIKASQDYSKWGWRHTDSCPISYTSPHLGITNTQAAKFTWKEAEFIKEMVTKKNVDFYRKVSQKAVDKAREFFPLTCSYEFPNKTFRDVYFAYLPSKEQDTFAFGIVKPHDTRIISKKYSCRR